MNTKTTIPRVYEILVCNVQIMFYTNYVFRGYHVYIALIDIRLSVGTG